jgi:hypothetical protein
MWLGIQINENQLKKNVKSSFFILKLTTVKSICSKWDCMMIIPHGVASKNLNRTGLSNLLDDHRNHQPLSLIFHQL